MSVSDTWRAVLRSPVWVPLALGTVLVVLDWYRLRELDRSGHLVPSEGWLLPLHRASLTVLASALVLTATKGFREYLTIVFTDARGMGDAKTRHRVVLSVVAVCAVLGSFGWFGAKREYEYARSFGKIVGDCRAAVREQTPAHDEAPGWLEIDLDKSGGRAIDPHLVSPRHRVRPGILLCEMRGRRERGTDLSHSIQELLANDPEEVRTVVFVGKGSEIEQLRTYSDGTGSRRTLRARGTHAWVVDVETKRIVHLHAEARDLPYQYSVRNGRVVDSRYSSKQLNSRERIARWLAEMSEPDPLEGHLGLTAVSDLLRLPVKSIRKMAREGDLPSKVVDGVMWFPEDEVHQWRGDRAGE